MKITQKMPSWEGVGAGQTATCRLPVGLTYHKVFFSYAGVTLAQMKEIRVYVNAQTLIRVQGGDTLDKLNQFDGMAAAAGFLTIDFERFALRTRVQQEATALRTGDRTDKRPITSIRVEIDIDAAASAPVLGVPKAVQSPAAVAGPLKILRTLTYSPSAAGDFEIADLPRVGDISRITFKHSGNLDGVKLTRDGFVTWERSEAENNLLLADGIRVPQTNFFMLDTTEEGNGQEAIRMAGVQDFRLTLDMAGADTVELIIEYISGLLA